MTVRPLCTCSVAYLGVLCSAAYLGVLCSAGVAIVYAGQLVTS